MAPSHRAPAADRLADDFAAALDEVAAAAGAAKAAAQTRAYALAADCLAASGTSAPLAQLAEGFDAAGLFAGSDWNHPSGLQPQLVPAALHGNRQEIAVEILSELRFLALAEERAHHRHVAPAEARAFLANVLAWNLDLLFPESSEASRQQDAPLRRAIVAHLELIAGRIGLALVLERIVDEAERILNQRPIVVNRVSAMLAAAQRALDDAADTAVRTRAARLLAAVSGPTPRSQRASTPEAYAAELAETWDRPAMLAEARGFAESLHAHGLASPYHAVFLREAHRRGNERLVITALGLDGVGRMAFDAYEELAMRLLDEAVFPATAQCIDGLAAVLNDGRLFHRSVSMGLWRLIRAPLHPTVERELYAAFGEDPGGAAADAMLLAGAISVLGRPMGVVQGDNPSCQSARAISLWSQCNPGFFLDLVREAGRDNSLTMYFEGHAIDSSALSEGLVEEFHTELDAASVVLVPHLDRIYWEFGRRLLDEAEDAHKWINPEFHGWWVFRGFATAIDPETEGVREFTEFMRRFFASYHPDYNGGRDLVYPQPAGIAATDLHGDFLGWHAVAIERVELDDDDRMRVYFYNPNNDGGQDWGGGIVTSTQGNGEIPGESSLPFAEFAARLYLFHYEPRELGDVDAVPAAVLQSIEAAARESWAAELPWA